MSGGGWFLNAAHADRVIAGLHAEINTERARWEQAEAALAAMREALGVERNYWQTRSHLARTKAEEVMAEYHLDAIDAALAASAPEGGAR